MTESGSPSVWSIGHSTRSIEDFVAALTSFRIETLVDVRSFPGSRRFPQFSKDRLSAALAGAKARYVHFPDLGGRRPARPDSLNLAWRNEGFRGYADYMESEDFRKAVERLLKLAHQGRTVIMCAEAVWWRCHRSLISDYLKLAGIEVIHIFDAERAEHHPYTSAARIVDGALSYRSLLSE